MTLAPHVEAALVRGAGAGDGAVLVFDRARLEANFAQLAAAARAHGIVPLFAMKAFPHADVWELARAHVAGFDVASAREAAAANARAVAIVSIADPAAGPVHDAARATRVIASCEDLEHVARAPARADIAIRLSASAGGRDPAVGAILDGTGHRRSRFGVDIDPPSEMRPSEMRPSEIRPTERSSGERPSEIRPTERPSGERPSETRPTERSSGERPSEIRPTERSSGERSGAGRTAMIAAMRAAAGQRRVGVHVHAGAVTATTPARFVAMAREALAAAAAADFEPAFVNLGGAWHGLPDLAAAFAAIRAAIPPAIEILVEPGRLVSRDAGFAAGRILATRALHDRRLCVTALSRTCHLRWSPIERVGPPPAAGDGVATVFAGSTCFEDDVVGEWIVPPALPDHLVVRGVTGYAVAWNTGFGTIAPADVTLV